MEIKIREMAAELGITAQAIRNMKNRNTDIAEHFHMKGRTWYIDEEGQEMIKERSLGKPPSQVMSQDLYQELEEYKKRVIDLQQQNLDLMQQSVQNMLAADKVRLLEEVNNDLQDKYEKQIAANASLQEKVSQLEDELSGYEKSWFGLYKKVK